MNARQFSAPTAREAMALARKALGPDAVILSNRKTAHGISVTAMLESDLLGLGGNQNDLPNDDGVSSKPGLSGQRESVAGQASELAQVTAQTARVMTGDSDAAVVADESGASAAPMSTLRFQQFANERHTRRHQEKDNVPDAAKPAANGSSPEIQRPDRASEAAPVRLATNSRAAAADTVRDSARATVPVNQTGSTRVGGSAHEDSAAELTAMAAELRQMRSFISQQFSALSWVDGVRRTPGQAQVLRRLLEAGFSAQLARSLVGHLPAQMIDAEANQWLSQALVKNLKAPAWSQGIIDEGGVFALVGPTGVGKTTSVAKIAARCALDHGVDQVGLITADAYRVGAQDQLRRFGSMIGITVHTAHDSQSLLSLLGLLQNKRTVLIDTAGLGQRDERVAKLLDAVSQGPIQRLLVLSAAAQTESMREAMEAYRGNDCAGVLLTKTDEACRLGGALDTLIRFRLPLLAVANGQRVPEDWQEANPERLIEQAFSVFNNDQASLPDIDLTMLMQRVDAKAEDDIELVTAGRDSLGVW